jgi:hypothetical protein
MPGPSNISAPAPTTVALFARSKTPAWEKVVVFAPSGASSERAYIRQLTDAAPPTMVPERNSGDVLRVPTLAFKQFAVNEESPSKQ